MVVSLHESEMRQNKLQFLPRPHTQGSNPSSMRRVSDTGRRMAQDEMLAGHSIVGGSCKVEVRKQSRGHLLIWPCARKSAMSALQVGQGFMTLRSRMVRPEATGPLRPGATGLHHA